MPVCPRQCHFGCVLVGIEHGVHEREARVVVDPVACAASAQWSELCCIGDTDGCLCVWFALLVVWLVVYAPGTPMCVRVGSISR